jgi:predicted lactoylglutathione lyase
LRADAIENHKMKTRCFDHIDLRVTDMETAKSFTENFCHSLDSFTKSPGDPSILFFRRRRQAVGILWLSQDKNHKPNRTRIAFWADTRREVDEIAKLVREAGGKKLEGPEVCKGYSPGYYAFFFEDPDGNKLEICCREKPVFAD